MIVRIVIVVIVIASPVEKGIIIVYKDERSEVGYFATLRQRTSTSSTTTRLLDD